MGINAAYWYVAVRVTLWIIGNRLERFCDVWRQVASHESRLVASSLNGRCFPRLSPNDRSSLPSACTHFPFFPCHHRKWEWKIDNPLHKCFSRHGWPALTGWHFKRYVILSLNNSPRLILFNYTSFVFN